MPIQWKEKIANEFDLSTGKKQLHLASRKIDVNRNLFHLVIGLGGSGVRALMETKGLIEQTCRNPGSRVAYLAFDTDDKGLKNARSSKETGEVQLDIQKEAVLMSDNGLHQLFAASFVNQTLAAQPELFTWVDERINPAGTESGASGTRQIARLVVSKNYNSIIQRIQNTIMTLTADNVEIPNPQLIVYVITGISGGTGSGAFMDMPYLVRNAITSAGFEKMTQVYGYVFTPDINYNNGASNEMLKRNAYAALQELDYNLSLRDLSETYNIFYPRRNYMAGGAGNEYFDKIHMISGRNDAGVPMSMPLEHGARVIAQNILSFVANEQVDTAQPFTITQHYSNLTGRENAIIGALTDPHRYHRYLAIGSAEFELPIDDIMIYVATLLFERMDAMYDRTPKTEDVDEAMRQLKLTKEGLFGELRGQVQAAQLVPQDQNFNALGANKNYWLSQGMQAYNTVHAQAAGAIGNIVANTLKTLRDEFMKYMQSAFQNNNEGPVFVHRVIHYDANADGVLDRIQTMLSELKKYWIGYSPNNCAVIAPSVQQYSNLVNAMNDRLPFIGGAAEKVRRAQAINQIGRTVYNQCVNLALAEVAEQVLTKMESYIKDRAKNLFEIVVIIMEQLRHVFKENGDILTDSSLVVGPEQRVYTWSALDVPVISYCIKQRFDEIIRPQANDVIQDFVGMLWSKAQEWVRDPNSYDPNEFLSGFIDRHFDSMAELSLEAVLTDLLTVSGVEGTLEDGIENNLMPWLEGQSRPLYTPSTIGGVQAQNTPYRLISVPNNCRAVYDIIAKYCDEHYGNTCTLQKSDIRTRIYMQTVTCGLSLAEFSETEAAEKSYAGMRDQTHGGEGLHLVHTLNSPHARVRKTWNDLYTLIPRCRRPDVLFDPNVQKLLDEEDERKALFRNLVEEGSPMMRLHRDQGPWKLDVLLTEPRFRIEDGRLEWVSGPDENNLQVLKTWDTKGSLDELRAAQAEVRELLVSGIQALPGSRTITRTVNGSLIVDQISGVVHEEHTWDYLLEMCQCSLELVYGVRAEKEKFETLKKFAEQLKAAYDVAYAELMRREMYAFVKLLLNGDIQLGQNPVDQSFFFSIAGFGDTGIDIRDVHDEDDHAVNFKLYNAFVGCRNDTDQDMLPVQRQIEALLKVIDEKLGTDVSMMDEIYREQLLGAIERINAPATLNALRMTTGASKEEIAFYEEFISQLNSLKKMLQPREVAPVIRNDKPAQGGRPRKSY